MAEVQAKLQSIKALLNLKNAVTKGDLKNVMFIIDQGVSVVVNYAMTDHKDTLLHLAVNHGDKEIAEERVEEVVEIVRFLLEKKADINAINIFGETPLHIAAAKGCTKIVETLLEKKADINAKNYNGDTPLHLAAAKGCTKTVETLLKKGADIDAKNNVNCTPLHLAAKIGNKEIVQLLLKNGAKIGAKNTDGKTALDIARAQKHQDIIKILENAKNTQRSYGLYCATAAATIVATAAIIACFPILVPTNGFEIANEKHAIVLGIACVSTLLSLICLTATIINDRKTLDSASATEVVSREPKRI